MTDGADKYRTVDAIVTGIVRDPEEFSALFRYVFAERVHGTVRNIIFSTWRSTAETNPGELSWLNKNNVKVVLSQEPPKTMMGNTWKQHRALLTGLAQVSEDGLILKTRTDKSLDQTRLVMESFKNQGLDAAGGASPFDRKIICSRLSTSMMFNNGDIAFIGAARDLKKLINFEGYYDVVAVPSTINAEIRMFSWPFVKQFGFVGEIFENFNIRRISAKLIESRGNDVPLYLLAAYARFFRIASESFQLADWREWEAPCSFSSVWEAAPLGVAKRGALKDGFHLAISNDHLLRMLGQLNLMQDTHLQNVKRALERIEELPLSSRILNHFPQDELLVFDRAMAGTPPAIRFDPVPWSGPST